MTPIEKQCKKLSLKNTFQCILPHLWTPIKKTVQRFELGKYIKAHLTTPLTMDTNRHNAKFRPETLYCSASHHTINYGQHSKTMEKNNKEKLSLKIIF